jgi:hypothetical protein
MPIEICEVKLKGAPAWRIALDYEKLGVFYLGNKFDLDKGGSSELVLYDCKDLVTHAVLIGMTGSGKTGLGITMLEEAAMDGIPFIAIDPKGDLANLLLTFPDLKGSDFAPWISADDARRAGQSVEQFSAAEARRWQEGLTASQQNGARIARLRENFSFKVFTPGSSAGLPVSALSCLDAPGREELEDSDLLRQRVTATATCILALLGISGDPLRSREHILVASIINALWQEGKDIELAELIALIQKPPMTRIGALDLESFYPAKERFELAMSINNLLASPGFDVWLEGAPLDVDRFLWSDDGKPQGAIFSIAHLSDSERMFFVTILLQQVLGWMRKQSGTTSLRALLYMDEIFGYFPPVANPPSKGPLLTLLKQARAFGLGLVLASQNPVDIDYKGLANAGTWFIGRLQTERDKARLLDGLENSSAEGGAHFDRKAISEILGRLGKRIFLMNNIHESQPVVFESRFTMSYLRGPLNRQQIKDLMQPLKAKMQKQEQLSSPGSRPEANSVPDTVKVAPKAAAPILAAEIKQFFIPSAVASFSDKPRRIYQPVLLASAQVRFVDTKLGIDTTIDRNYLVPASSGPVPIDFARAKSIKITLDELSSPPLSDFTYAEPESALTLPGNYKGWSKDFLAYLAGKETLKLASCRATGDVSRPQESERDFRIRIAQAAGEKRDSALGQLRQKYAASMGSISDRISAAEQKLAAEEAEARQHELNSAITIGATVFGALMSRRPLGTTNLGRAASAARTVSRVAKQKDDVGRAEDNLAQLQERFAELNRQFESEAQAVSQRFSAPEISTIAIPVKKSNISVRFLGLAWVVS